MRFSIEHSFRDTSLERFLAVYFSDAFNRHVDPQIGVQLRAPLECQEQDGGRIYRRTRVVPTVQLPARLQRMLGRERIEYVEVSTFDPTRHSLDYCIEHVAAKHLRVWGEIRFEAIPGGVRRVLDLNVEVDVPLVRGLVERILETELRKAYARIAELTQAWLDREDAP